MEESNRVSISSMQTVVEHVMNTQSFQRSWTHRLALAGLAMLSALSFTPTALAQSGSTLEAVRERGAIRCGANNQLPGFASVDSDGNYFGFDIDICRAVAAAVFGDPDQVEYIPLTAANRQSAMQAGEVDIMSRNTTWTLTRDRDWGVTYGPTTYYDGQGFIVPNELGISTLDELSGATICVLAGTTTELNLADVFRARSIDFEAVTLDEFDSAFSAYEEGRCDAVTTDQSSLISRRTTLEDPDAHTILEEVISKEPLGPLVTQGDPQWSDIMNWTVFALFYAEEVGITSDNIGTFTDGENPDIARFLGEEGDLAELLGLESGWVVNVIEGVGNYGEIFDRHLTPLGVSRGLNQPYTQGGILYSPPFR